MQFPDEIKGVTRRSRKDMTELCLPRAAEVSQRVAGTARPPSKPRGANWLFKLGTCTAVLL